MWKEHTVGIKYQFPRSSSRFVDASALIMVNFPLVDFLINFESSSKHCDEYCDIIINNDSIGCGDWKIICSC